MSPRDFCNWFQGVFEMAQNDLGEVSFSQLQVMKIEARLKEALKPEGPGFATSPPIPPHMLHGGDSNVRC